MRSRYPEFFSASKVGPQKVILIVMHFSLKWVKENQEEIFLLQSTAFKTVLRLSFSGSSCLPSALLPIKESIVGIKN